MASAPAGLPPPRLPTADLARLRSLRSRTALIRSELRHALRELENAGTALRVAAEGESGDDELRRVVSAAAKDVSAHVQDLAVSIERFEQQLHERPERLVAAFFGRTMAGKSTLVETLVGGDGAAIGRGGQRTTRVTRHCKWGDLVLYDTPGIGAFEGEEDARIARRDVRDADLVVFVITDDSLQEEHFRGLEHVRDENKPVLFLLNAKLAVDQPLLRKRLLSGPDEFLGHAALRGHLDRLDELASKLLGLAEYRVVAVQAQAAWLGSTRGDAELLAASRVSEAVEAVTELVTRDAVPLRVRSTYDPSILKLERVATNLAVIRDDLQAQSLIYSQRAAALRQELHVLADTHEARVRRTVTEHLADRRAELLSWLDKHISRKDFNEQVEGWLALEALEEAVLGHIEAAFERMDAICSSALQQLVAELETHLAIDSQVDGFQLTDWRKAFATLKRAVQVTGVLFKVATLTKWGKRLGGAAGPVALAVLIGTEALAQLAKRFPQYNPARRVALSKAAKQLDRALVRLQDEAVTAGRQPVDDVIATGAAARLVGDLTDGATRLASAAADLNAATVRIRAHSRSLSASMCSELLDGKRLDLWCRVPGQVLAIRHPLAPRDRAVLKAATGEALLELPGTASDAIRTVVPGCTLSWRMDSLSLRCGSAQRPGEFDVEVVERIAQRAVIVSTGA